MNEKLRIAYIEDHKIVKEGVNYLLSQYPGIEMVENEFDWAKMSDFIFTHKINLFIIDLQLSGTKSTKHPNGFEICESIRANFPAVSVMAHSMYDDVENINKIFSKGAMAFVSKKSGHLELLNAIKYVSEGKRYVCKETAKKTKNPARFMAGKDELLKPISEMFSKTEKSVLEKIAKGFSTKQIAQQLHISEKTVETHRKHLFDKAKVKNVAELIAYTYSRRLFID
jgi:DNA-binding NarL/FixJ family response regulator